MEWQDQQQSEIVTLLKGGKLPHPTSNQFDFAAWRAAIEALKSITKRDRDLVASALMYGRARGVVREEVPHIGLSREQDVRLLAALLNQQFLTARIKAKDIRRVALESGPIHVEHLAQKLIKTSNGQEFNAEDLYTTLVDTAPVRLADIWAMPEAEPAALTSMHIESGMLNLRAASLENSLRGLWQHALWSGHVLVHDGAGVPVDTPSDRQLAEHWVIWTLRQEALASYELLMNMGAAVVAGRATRAASPVNRRTVVKLKRRENGRRRFLVGDADGRNSLQRAHVAEFESLQRLYTGLFLNEPLPRIGVGNLTCHDLNAAWWVLEDLASLVIAELGPPFFDDDKGVGRFAIPVDLADLTRLLVEALAIDEAKAATIISIFTCDPTDTKRLFGAGLWTTPFIPAPGGDRIYLFLAPLLVGTPQKRVEAWLEMGGVSDQNGVKGRGKPFESHVRLKLAEAIGSNPALEDAIVDPDPVRRRRGAGEEIDLLVRVGSTVLVGEVKCFTGPSSALQQHNHLRNLAKAAEQAKVKLEWTQENRRVVAARLGVQGDVQVEQLKFIPVVVLSNSYGVGLSRDGVPIVDLHYLSLILGSTHYQGETWFEQGVGMKYRVIDLYADQAHFERRVENLLSDPIVLLRYRESIGWRRNPFSWAEREGIWIAMPGLIKSPA
jgi:hypothetical protein